VAAHRRVRLILEIKISELLPGEGGGKRRFAIALLVVGLACAFKSVGGYPGALRGAHMSRKTKPCCVGAILKDLLEAEAARKKSPSDEAAGAKVTQSRVEFPATGATITAIASDYAGAAGANPTISCFDELWGYTSERSRRLWDEMIPSPRARLAADLRRPMPASKAKALFSKSCTTAGARYRASARICTLATVC
jgi:hypothetical protein